MMEYNPSMPQDYKGNGCGPKGFGWLVPDMFGRACVIHDYDYEVATTHEDYVRADKRFRRNMRAWIGQQPYLMKPLWLPLSELYYHAVRARTAIGRV